MTRTHSNQRRDPVMVAAAASASAIDLDEMTRQASDDGLYEVDAPDYVEALRRARRH